MLADALPQDEGSLLTICSKRPYTSLIVKNYFDIDAIKD